MSNGLVKEEVFVKQPPGFESFSCPDYVFKLTRAIYGLKQTPTLGMRIKHLLLGNNFQPGKIDATLLLQNSESSILIV